jgi:hypothetical protein
MATGRLRQAARFSTVIEQTSEVANRRRPLNEGFRASGGLLADIDARVPTGACATKELAIHQRIEERVTRARIQTPQSLSL